MDELKDAMFERFCNGISAYLEVENIALFKECIEISCRAQAQACFRASERQESILSATIIEDDYSGLLLEDIC